MWADCDQRDMGRMGGGNCGEVGADLPRISTGDPDFAEQIRAKLLRIIRNILLPK